MNNKKRNLPINKPTMSIHSGSVVQASQKRGSGSSHRQRSSQDSNGGGKDSDSDIEQGRLGKLSGQDSISLLHKTSVSLDARQILEINGGRPANMSKQRSVQGIMGNQSNRFESSRFVSDNVSAGNKIMHDLVAEKLYRGRMDTTSRNEDDIRAISIRLEEFLDQQIIQARLAPLTARGNNNISNSNNSAKQHHSDSFRSRGIPPNPRSPINVLLSRISQRVAPDQLQELVPGGITQELLPGVTSDTRARQRRPSSVDVRPLTVRQMSRPFLFGLSLKSRDDMKNDSKEGDQDHIAPEPKQVIMYNAWLDFATPEWRSEEKRMEYLSFKRSDTNIILKIFVFSLLVVFGGTMVLVHYTVPASSSVQAAFIISLVFALIAIISAFFTICMHFSLLSTWYDHIRATLLIHDSTSYPSITLCVPIRYNVYLSFIPIGSLLLFLSAYRYQLNVPCMPWLLSSQQDMFDSRSAQMAEDMVLFFLQLTASTFLLATSLNLKPILEMESQICPAVELPPDLVCMAMSIVLLIQIFSKGSRKSCLVLSWITSIIFTNVCLYLIHSSLYFWIDVTYFFLLAISYELERQTLRHFIKSLMAVEIIEYNAELKLQLANQMIHEGEQSLQAKRSIVRHVGHEIRTPLNTIAIGGDILAQELAAIQPPLPASTIEIVASIQEASANALETVNELLCFEKISAGKHAID